MIKYAKSVRNEPQDNDTSNVMINESIYVSNETPTISLTPYATHTSNHTVTLLGKKQVQYIWCSRINSVERKTTMKCMECNKEFCSNNSGRCYWLHHIAMGGYPQPPE